MERAEKEHIAVIGLGSNLGDRAAYLLRAVERILSAGIEVSRLSDIYETDPIDYLDQPSFLNMVAILSGARLPSAPDLLSICLKIEVDLGRDRAIPKGPRVIDLDLLIYDDLICEDRSSDLDLILPHPRLHERRFVLVPLVELLPAGIHPKLRKSYSRLLEDLGEGGGVVRYRP
jgi:2-amino-4-hydroxy-6-hydroxymethyldihydropteridine diphosphokinase